MCESADITPLDFFLSVGLDGEQCSQRKVCSQDEVLACSLDSAACIEKRADSLRRTTLYLRTRVEKCVAVDGGTFEHLL
jgi:hypothetical protein